MRFQRSEAIHIGSMVYGKIDEKGNRTQPNHRFELWLEWNGEIVERTTSTKAAARKIAREIMSNSGSHVARGI